MQDHEFDEILRGKLDGHVSPVPEDMWTRVTGEKRRRLPFWVWWVLVPGLLLGGAGSYWLWGRPRTAARGSTADTAASATGAQRSAVGASDGTGAENTAEARRSAAGASDETGAENTVEARRNAAGASDGTGEESVTGDQRDATDASGGMPSAKGAYPAGPDGGKSAGQGRLPAAGTASDQGQSQRGDQDDEGHSPQNTRFGASPILLKKTADNADVNDQRATLPGARVLRPAKMGADSTAKRRDTARKSRWAIEVLGSPDYAPAVVIPSWGYTAGIRVRRQFNDKISGTVGLEYSLVHAITGGDSIGGRHFGSMRNLDLPLLLGYNAWNRHFTATVQAGPVVTAYSWRSIRDASGTSQYSPNKVGLSLYLGLNLDFPVDKRFSLFAEPYYRWRVTDMRGPTPYLSYPWKVNVEGLSLGLRWTIERRPRAR